MYRLLLGYMISAVVVLVLLSWAETGSLERGLRLVLAQDQLGKSVATVVFFTGMQFVIFQLVPQWFGKPKVDK